MTERQQEGDILRVTWLGSTPLQSPKGDPESFIDRGKALTGVVKVISDVIYRIQIVSSCEQGQPDRRRWHCLLVHLNRLKPCHFQKTAVTPPKDFK